MQELYRESVDIILRTVCCMGGRVGCGKNCVNYINFISKKFFTEMNWFIVIINS